MAFMITMVSNISIVTIGTKVPVTTIYMVTTVSIVTLHLYMINAVWGRRHHVVLRYQAVHRHHAVLCHCQDLNWDWDWDQDQDRDQDWDWD